VIQIYFRIGTLRTSNK